MLETIVVLLILLWLLGFSFNVAAGTVHVLLVFAVILIIVRMIDRRIN